MRAKDDLPLWFWVVGPVVVVIAAVSVLTLLRQGDPADRGAAATLEHVADNPSQFFGERVTVGGEVVEILGPRSLLVSERFIAGDLLVVSSIPLREVDDLAGDTPLTEGDSIRITGEVRRFDLREVEQEVGADLSEETLDAYVGTSAIIADAISLKPPDVPKEGSRPVWGWDDTPICAGGGIL